MTSFVSANGSDKEVSYTVTSSGVSTEGTTDFNTTWPGSADLYGQCIAYTKLKNLLNVDCQAKVKSLKKEWQEKRKEMNQDIKEDRIKMKQEIKDERQEFHSGAVETRKDFNEGVKEKRQDMKNQVQAAKKALSEKNRAFLEKAVSVLSLERLQLIITKVEKTLSLAKKERVIAQLNEISEIVQNKINELTGSSSEDDVLNNVLGTDITSTGTTTVTP